MATVVDIEKCGQLMSEDLPIGRIVWTLEQPDGYAFYSPRNCLSPSDRKNVYFVQAVRPYCCKISFVPGQTTRKSAGKVKVTVSLSRSAAAALDRIAAKRLESGASRREIQQSALIEEAIQALRQKEEV